MDQRTLAPIHPGEVLREEFLGPLGISQYRVSKEISVPPRRINEIVRGARAISADTALRLARYFGTSDRFWLNLQSRYDLETEKERLGNRLDLEVGRMGAIAWWVYKCSVRNKPDSYDDGDWRDFFDKRSAGGRTARWGLTTVIPALKKLRPGDTALAYQTDRNELVGLVRMVRFDGKKVMFEAIEKFGVKVRPLKKFDPAIERITAFGRGPKNTLCPISEEEARRVIDIARRCVGNHVGAGVDV
jgi:addiction module HigA family antidote